MYIIYILLYYYIYILLYYYIYISLLLYYYIYIYVCTIYHHMYTHIKTMPSTATNYPQTLVVFGIGFITLLIIYRPLFDGGRC